MKDEIVEEVHEIRRKIAEECNYDLKLIMKKFSKITEEEKKKGRKVITLEEFRAQKKTLHNSSKS